jgi:hypothetical protein
MSIGIKMIETILPNGVQYKQLHTRIHACMETRINAYIKMYKVHALLIDIQ